ncbi:lipopolysaccharide transport periplasmic protein LptA [Paracoccus aerodenitrificans]|uniref:lipopolysaccharide transport periplasmic protein LptA n=1 Tax=Paracoccus aerodenitrificans TaxID=3017781 RepID=UPI0022F11294|nr:lipopolysaccharide transport periplasmic protein LptA [Paracoccus aerodenitrificans]WBU63674.1 lipopolysaccharide transport periplasmic protein LptA [Paracoccus aerodenitrificans]
MRRALTFALLVTTLPAFPVAAQTIAFGGARADTTAPVELSADNLTVNQSTGQAVFSGNVLIGQGEMRLSADNVVVKYADGDTSTIENLDATGNVTLVNGPDAAEAEQAIYEVGSGNITLIGDVLLTQGQNVMSGERMLVNLGDGTAQVSGRVRSVLQPENN